MSRLDEVTALIEEKKRRLHYLKLQEARKGYSTPPEVSIEIEDIEQEIKQLERQADELATAPGNPPPAAAPAGPSFADLKRRTLEKQIKDLQEEYNAASAQWSYTLSEVDRVRIQRKLEDLEKRIGKLEAELASLPAGVRQSAAPRPNPAPRLLRVFLSHASEDKPQVREAYHRLVAEGIDAWLDEEKLLPGQDWNLEIRKAVRSSDVVMVFLSARAVTKAGYVQKEIKLALDVADQQPESAIFLIPVKLESCDVPDRLSHVQ